MLRRLVACLVAVALVSGCAGVRKVNIYTVPQEMAAGEMFASQVDAYYPILDDPRISWYLNHRGRFLAGLSQRNDLPYTFAALDTPELNAFAIPGGHVYFNIGMLEAADTESELLGVMAHETGHAFRKIELVAGIPLWKDDETEVVPALRSRAKPTGKPKVK